MYYRSARRVGYWTCTAVTAFIFLSGGAAYLVGAEVPLRGMADLGYPPYFVSILGAWKLFGGLTILAPRLPRLKEWAYAGIAFDLTGAAFSHAAMGSPTLKVVVPLIFLGIAAASWALRPASRGLLTRGERRSAGLGQPDGSPDAPECLLEDFCVVLRHDRQVIEQVPIGEERRVGNDALLPAER